MKTINKNIRGIPLYKTFNDGEKDQIVILFDERMEIYALYQKNQVNLKKIIIDKSTSSINKIFLVDNKEYSEVTVVESGENYFDNISNEIILLYMTNNINKYLLKKDKEIISIISRENDNKKEIEFTINLNKTIIVLITVVLLFSFFTKYIINNNNNVSNINATDSSKNFELTKVQDSKDKDELDYLEKLSLSLDNQSKSLSTIETELLKDNNENDDEFKKKLEKLLIN